VELVEALCFKPEDHGSIPDKIFGYFNGPNPSSHTMALGSTQPLTEMSARNLPGCKGQVACKSDAYELTV
jgi:hypothetical protein